MRVASPVASVESPVNVEFVQAGRRAMERQGLHPSAQSAADEITYHRSLIKFLFVSAVSLFIGTIHGMLQVLPPIRAWLDSIGSPYGGPGHMIDPLAHAHMNLVGGVVMVVMGVTYYLLPILGGRAIYSVRLVHASFWLMTAGVFLFYTVQMVFGGWEGYLLLHESQALHRVHHWYGPLVAVSGTVMAAGFTSYFINVALTIFSPAPSTLR